MKSAWQNVLKVTGKVVLWTAGVILGLMIVLEVVLSGTFLTRMVEKVAVNQVSIELRVADKGKTVTRLAPMGSVRFGDEIVEAKALEGMIDPNVEVEICMIEDGKIYVVPYVSE